MFGKLGVAELGIILVIVLVVFGPKHLPKLGKTFGKTVKNIREGIDKEVKDNTDIDDEIA